MARLMRIQQFVYNALVDHPETRADDFILVLEVYKNFISAEMSLKTILEHHIELGLPSFASIFRTRRRLQRKHPELVNKAAADMRAEEEKEYRAYAIHN